MLTLKTVDSQAKNFSQLPVHSYIDPHIFEIEKKVIFDKYQKYLFKYPELKDGNIFNQEEMIEEMAFR